MTRYVAPHERHATSVESGPPMALENPSRTVPLGQSHRNAALLPVLVPVPLDPLGYKTGIACCRCVRAPPSSFRAPPFTTALGTSSPMRFAAGRDRLGTTP